MAEAVEKMTKTEAVKSVSRELGPTATTAQIVAHLAGRGVKVSTSHVANVLSSGKGRRAGRKRAAVGSAASAAAVLTPASNGNGKASVGNIVSMAKRLLHDVGSVEECKKLFDALN